MGTEKGVGGFILGGPKIVNCPHGVRSVGTNPSILVWIDTSIPHMFTSCHFF